MQTVIDTPSESTAARAASLREQGLLAEAEAVCQQLIREKPDSADAYFQRALIAAQKKAWQESLDSLEKAISLNPHDAAYHASYGATLFMLERYIEATEALERAIALDPKHTVSLNNLAYIYSLSRRHTEAEKLLQWSLQLDPHQADAWLSLCHAVQEMDFREADIVRYAQQAIALRPQDPIPYSYLSKALLRQGDPRGALDAIRIAAHLDDSNAGFQYHSGVCLLQLDEVAEAILAFQQALAIDPDHGETYHALADFLYKIEDFPAAEEACRQALHLQPFKLPPEMLLAKILFVSGQHEESKEHYDNCKTSADPLYATRPEEDKSIVANVQTVESWALETGNRVMVVLPERLWHPESAIFFGSRPEGTLYTPVNIPKVYVAEIEDATVVSGHEVILVNQTHTALYDRLVRIGDWYGLREEELVPLISNDHVLIDPGPRANEKIPAGIFLMSEAWSNYAHWVSEQLPRLFTIEKFPEYDGLPVLINDGLFPQQLDALQRICGSRHPIKILSRTKRYEVERLICPSIMNAYNKRRYRLSEGATTSDGPFHPEAIQFVRERLLPQCRQQQHGAKRLWISRKKQIRTGQRRLLNEAELEALYVAHGFEVVQPETMSFMEQMELFSQAEMIVGPGGAGMMNIVFAPPGCKILMFTKNHPQINLFYFTNIAKIIGQEIAYAVGDPVINYGVLGFETDFRLDIDIAKQALADFFRLA